MKKNQIAILLAILVGVIAVTVSFAGCSKSQSSAGTSSQSSASVQSYKQQLDVSLSPLVKDGTITTDQEGKIIDAYATLMSSRPSGMNGSRPSGMNGSRPSGMNGSRPSGMNGSRPSGMNNAFSPLSKLVTAKTITQAQADAVTKAISASGIGFGGGGGGFGGGNGGGNGQNGQTTAS